jgi:hypothetical protein
MKDHRPSDQRTGEGAHSDLVAAGNEAHSHLCQVLAMLEEILESSALAQARILAPLNDGTELLCATARIAAQDLRHAPTLCLRGSGLDPLADCAQGDTGKFCRVRQLELESSLRRSRNPNFRSMARKTQSGIGRADGLHHD